MTVADEWTAEGKYGRVLRCIGIAEAAIDSGNLRTAFGPFALALGAVELLDDEARSWPWSVEAHDIEHRMRTAVASGVPPLSAETRWLLQRAAELLIAMRRRLDQVADDRAVVAAMETGFGDLAS